MKENLVRGLDKLLSMLVDRRALVYVIGFVSLLFGLDYSEARIDTLSNEWVDAFRLIIPAVYLILGQLGLLTSWAMRAPSGLRYKKPAKELEENLEKLGIDA